METSRTHLVSHVAAVKAATIVALIIVAIGIAVETGYCAQADVPVSGPAVPLASKRLVPADRVELLADGIVSSTMAEYLIPGITLSVVLDGEPILIKGYGYADMERKIPVDPYRHMFRIGSVSKTFTWTAIMQLAEAHRIDLNADVNEYLDGMQIADFHGLPISLNDLMAHRPGFEDGALGYLFARHPDEVVPLEEWLRLHQPARVRRPGEAVSYSNYGAALAGLIVQQVSGLPFDDYVERNILRPLHMLHTSFREPLATEDPVSLSPELSVEIAKGHVRSDGRVRAAAFEYIHSIAPAGSASSTASDMANFMIAYLQKGRFGDGRIYEETTANLMRQRNFSNRLEMTDFAHGFFNSTIAGYSAYGHPGATSYFRTNMVLVPKLRFGVFVSANQGPGRAAVFRIPSLLIENLFPQNSVQVREAPLPGHKDGTRRYEGTYMNNRRSFTKLEKLTSLFDGKAEVASAQGGYLTIDDGKLTTWTEYAPLTFRNVDSGEVIVFEQDDDGTIVRFNHPLGHMSYEKIGLLSTPIYFWTSLWLVFGLSLTTLLTAWRHRRSADVTQSSGTRFHGWTSRIAIVSACATLLLCSILGISLREIAAGGQPLFYEFPSTSAKLAVLISNAATILYVSLVGNAPFVARDRSWTIFQRFHYAIFALASLAAIIALAQWNLLYLPKQ